MVEYSTVTHFLLISGGVALLAVSDRVWNAVNVYLDGIYFVINSASL